MIGAPRAMINVAEGLLGPACTKAVQAGGSSATPDDQPCHAVAVRRYRPAVATWSEFAAAAPHISAIFTRRLTATRNLCMLATIRRDGSPRISPMEPRIFENELVLVGMVGTTKFRDLDRDPRFCLHTATVDTQVTDGDAKVWGMVRDLQDEALHQRFAADLFADIGLDLRGQKFEPFYTADVASASSVEVGDGHLDITIWQAGDEEHVVRKH